MLIFLTDFFLFMINESKKCEMTSKVITHSVKLKKLFFKKFFFVVC